MVVRMTALTALILGILGVMEAATIIWPDKTKPEDQAKVKKALQEVQDFIGQWNLEGTQKAGPKTEAWKEKVSWGWKFKDGDSWLTVDFADGKGKHFINGLLSYDLEKKKYVLTLTAADKGEQVFEGDVGKTGGLKLERKDVKTGDVHRLTLNTLADGVRFQLKYEKQESGKGIFASVFSMNGNKDGESIAGTSRKPECIVSGGAASMAVNYQGKQYFVCCTGCRDEFNANPEKYTAAKK
jgi:YHS domain-containing protein